MQNRYRDAEDSKLSSRTVTFTYPRMFFYKVGSSILVRSWYFDASEGTHPEDCLQERIHLDVLEVSLMLIQSPSFIDTTQNAVVSLNREHWEK